MSEQQTEQGVEFMIQKVFVKDLSYESPNTPVIFTKNWQPEAQIDLNTNSTSWMTITTKLH